MVALIDDLLNATDPAEILAHVARATWAKAHDGAECPDGRAPTPEALGDWVPECPEDARNKASELLGPLLGAPASWQRIIGARLEVMIALDEPAPGALMLDDGRGGWAPVALVALPRVHAAWCALPDPRPRHPLAPLVDAWQRLAPVPVEAETRADRRIMPALRVVGPSPERERGTLFGGLVEDRRPPELPLFPEHEPERLRVPLLELVDASGVPLRSRGRGAPIEARLIVRGGLLMIRPQDRGRTTVRVSVTVGELLAGLYPVADKRGHRRLAQHWPKIEAALRSARDFTITDATGGRWFPMALRRLPSADGVPDPADLVVIDLAPPPGMAAGGSTIDLPALDRLGLRSGPAWYAYIAARSLVWQPGTTRRPAPKAGRRWVWSANPTDYPVLTLADLRRFAFGTTDKGDRARAAILAPWEGLPDVVMVPNQTDPRTGIRGYRLLPAEAAVAVRRAYTTGE